MTGLVLVLVVIPLLAVLTLFVLYAVIRLAVRDGIRDAQARLDAAQR